MKDPSTLYHELTSDLQENLQDATKEEANSWSQSTYTRIHGAFRELFLKSEIPEQVPEDFDRLQRSFAYLAWGMYMFPGGITSPSAMPPEAFEEVLNILTTAYALGRREGYNERILEEIMEL